MLIRENQLRALRLDTRKRLSSRCVEDLRGRGLLANYDAVAGTLTTTDASGRSVHVAFGTDGLPIYSQRPSGTVSQFTWDADGRLERIVSGSSREIRFERNQDGNITSIGQSGVGSYRFTYASGRIARAEYPDGRHYTIVESENLRSRVITDRSGAQTSYEIDSAGVSIRDALGRVTQLAYTAEGALSEIVLPDGSFHEFSYDPKENTALAMGADGGVTGLHFGTSNSLAQIHWPDGSRTSFQETDDGRLTQVERNGAAVELGYDAGGQLAVEKSGGRQVGFRQDPEGRLIELRTPFGDAVAFDYDDDGRIRTVRDWENRVIEIGYDSEDQISELRFPNGVTEASQHGPIGRPQSLVLSHPAVGVIEKHTMGYDVCGRLLRRSVQTEDGQTETDYVYDAEDRLVREGPVHYRYDACGNMIDAAGVPVSYGANDNPRSVGGRPVDYDERGNITEAPDESGVLRCRFNATGLLERCDSVTASVGFEYDALGRRTRKRLGSAVWEFGWAAQHLLWEEYRVTPSARPVRRDYLFLPGAHRPLAFREAGQTYWLHADGRGAIIRATDQSGSTVWRATYDGFRTTVITAAIRQPWRLQGQYLDEETGLHYGIARYYSPHLRSFLSRDPRWLEFETTQYSYARNDPWNRSDPDGKFPPLLAAVGIAAVGGAVIGGVFGGIMAAREGKSILGGIAGGAVEGAVAGAGVALAAAAGAAAAVAGAGALVVGAVVIGGSAVAAGVGALAGTLTQQAVSGDPICLKCAFVDAGIAAGVTLALAGLGAIPGVRHVAKLAVRRVLKTSAGRWVQRKLRNVRIRKLPKEITEEEAKKMSAVVRQRAKELGYGDDIVVHGSRGSGLSLPKGDIDIAVRVSPEGFEKAVRRKFSNPAPGSAAEKTMKHALETGKLRTRDAGLTKVRDEVEDILGEKVKDVDLSLIRRDSQFDTGPIVPLP